MSAPTDASHRGAASLCSRLRKVINDSVGADADPPDPGAVRETERLLAVLGERYDWLAEKAHVAIARSGEIEIIVSLPGHVMSIFKDGSDEEFGVVLEDRHSPEMAEERSMTADEVADTIERLAA